jgi:hypothetical protein
MATAAEQRAPAAWRRTSSQLPGRPGFSQDATLEDVGEQFEPVRDLDVGVRHLPARDRRPGWRRASDRP